MRLDKFITQTVGSIFRRAERRFARDVLAVLGFRVKGPEPEPRRSADNNTNEKPNSKEE